MRKSLRRRENGKDKEEKERLRGEEGNLERMQFVLSPSLTDRVNGASILSLLM